MSLSVSKDDKRSCFDRFLRLLRNVEPSNIRVQSSEISRFRLEVPEELLVELKFSLRLSIEVGRSEGVTSGSEERVSFEWSETSRSCSLSSSDFVSDLVLDEEGDLGVQVLDIVFESSRAMNRFDQFFSKRFDLKFPSVVEFGIVKKSHKVLDCTDGNVRAHSKLTILRTLTTRANGGLETNNLRQILVEVTVHLEVAFPSNGSSNE